MKKFEEDDSDNQEPQDQFKIESIKDIEKPSKMFTEGNDI
jgi:hypothetical protein